jgi:cytochrome c oxidase subunit 2
MGVLKKLAGVELAADYGWGPYTLLWIFLITIIVATAGFFIVMATTRAKRKLSFAVKRKYHFEAFWAAGVAGVLIWLWIISYPWMPPVAFSSVNPDNKEVAVVNITAGQWFWLMDVENNKKPLEPGTGEGPHAEVVAGQPVKFIAHSIDVNHGFGVFTKDDDSAILFQMQVIPDVDNVFYYTFKAPGAYMVRCLEYCGYAHPYMTSIIEVLPAEEQPGGV